MSFVLETRQLCKRFGGIIATDNVDFRLPAGARHALIGPNGAGKTTFINQLTGVLRPTSGTILYDGQDMTHWPVRRRATAGIARTFQINQLFSDLTPLQSVLIAIAEREGAGGAWLRPLGTRRDIRRRGGRAARQARPCRPARRARRLPCPTASSACSRSRSPSPRSRKCCCSTSRRRACPKSEREQILDVVAPAAVGRRAGAHRARHGPRLPFCEDASRCSSTAPCSPRGRPPKSRRDPRVRQVYLGEEVIGHG